MRIPFVAHEAKIAGATYIKVLRVRANQHLVLLPLACFFGLAPALANQILVIQPVIAGTVGIATPDIQRDLLFAAAIYSQVSLDISFLPTETAVSLSTNLVENDASVLPYVTSPTYALAPVLTVFYVATINSDPSNRGTSTCLSILCAAWVANSAANDTLAHELAHILTNFQGLWDQSPSDPPHSTDPTNLLASGGIRNVPATISDITSAGSVFDRTAPIQDAAMLTSGYVQSDAPEPGSLIMGISGMLFLLSAWVLKRRGTL
jgi:hypothetical protein